MLNKQRLLLRLYLVDNNLRELAKHVTEQLRKSTTVDWQVRDSVRAKLRNLIRRALRR
jgi:type I restriction enzyme R subunit